MSETKWVLVDRHEHGFTNSSLPRWEIDDADGNEQFWIAQVINKEHGLLLVAAPEMRAALEALPLDAFDKDEALIDAADFVDNAAEFVEAMRLARAALKRIRVPA